MPLTTEYYSLTSGRRSRAPVDEIKKPRFLALKEFRWDRRLRSDDTSPSANIPTGILGQGYHSGRGYRAELQAEYPEFQPPKHGWFTLNQGWENSTDRVVDMVDSYGGANLPSRAYDQTGSDKSGMGRGIVFLAWGNWAAKRVVQLDKVS
ncbi:hypothetical protein PC9H_009586 [Pleurotus ostreatus]|uniref:Uncharacterized protein n=1 Tax=Pleurotus ostreatus TaxID=5322 RepID=A0A8H6ZU07_PLEOS|nr:uncharacterized protein PC9H_009586 [Pleurotus ostreatus]KAF7424280.1 hypothetical protein PC9H_009586 [Pleurotus ostreatus]